MKKLWNSIGVTILIFFSIMVCTSHIANKFFQKDIGTIVIGEVKLEQHLQDLFVQLETLAPFLDKDVLNNLKDEIVNNEEAKDVFGVASKNMLDDIVNKKGNQQDMKKVLKDLLYSYDDKIERVLYPLVSKQQIHTTIDKGLKYTPIQEVYVESIDSFQQSIPTNYMKLMRFINFISQEIIFIGSALISTFICVLLIICNRHRFRWAFSIGMAGMISGIALLVAGQVVPKVYQTMLQHMNASLLSVGAEDFHIISIYGITYFIIGCICFLLHFVYSKKGNAI